MKTYLYSFGFGILFFILSLHHSLQASHYMGVQLAYECIDSCTYRVYSYTYFDCSGGAVTLPGTGNPPVNNINFTGIPGTTGGSCIQPVPVGNNVYVSYQEVTPLCPSALQNPNYTACNGGSSVVLNGVLESVQYQDYNFCISGACPSYMVSFASCCRNGTITSGAANSGIYAEIIIDIDSSGCNNNSPVFYEDPVVYVCTGTPTIVNQGAVDPEGDSLVYSLGPCYSSPNLPVSYFLGYTSQQPLGPSWNVQLDSQTGMLSLIPNTTGLPVTTVLCIYVDEYRNGVWVGQIARDIQVAVLNCSGNNPPNSPSDLLNPVDAVLTAPDEVLVCPGSQASFDISLTDPDPGDTLFISSNADSILTGYTMTLTGTNPVTATFSWTPDSSDIGNTYFLTVKGSDDFCPIPGSVIRNYAITVGTNCIGGSTTSANCGDSTGGVNVFVSGLVPPVSYLWSTGDTSQNLVNVPPGVYSVTATGSGGQILTDTFTVLANDLIISGSVINQADCDQANGSIAAGVSGGTAPYTFLWNTGDTTATLSNIPSGGYSVYVTDITGCPNQETFLVEPPDTCQVTISGKAYYDLNNNCSFDAGDIPVPFAYVDFSPGGATWTDNQGNYSYPVDTGAVTISINPGAFGAPGCVPGNAVTLNFSSYLQDTSGVDFPVDTVGGGFDLVVWGAFSGGVISGSAVNYHISYQNYGLFGVSGTITWVHDSVLTFNSATPAPTSYDPVTRTGIWNFSNLMPGNPGLIHVNLTADSTVLLGTPVTTTLDIMPVAGDVAPQNNTFTGTNIVVASYDPNDKLVTPKGIGPEGFIQPDEDSLIYQVRFQNTGTYQASYVVIRDTLDSDLDVSTFEPLVASHPYTVRADEDSILVFTFADINLPDSASDPVGSQGQIMFRMSLKENLALGTEISNRAAIYFDFNAPVITNTVVNTIFDYPNLNITEAAVYCEGDPLEAVISAPGMPPYQIEWSDGTVFNNTYDTSFVIMTPATGWYSVSVTDAFGFSGTDSFYVEITEPPVADFIYTANGLDIQLTSQTTGNAVIEWILSDGSILSGNAPTHSLPVSGLYTIMMIATNDCGTDTTVQDVIVIATSLEDEFRHSVTVTPNPFEDRTRISFTRSGLQPVGLKIFDLNGKLARIIEPVNADHIDLERGDLSPGIYFMELSGKYLYTGKLVVR